ncbi:MAG: class I SAM-dependent methyltransferase [Candidatus Lindowbacteria bacterium]|nr:class I SAM-dependent methyltransferase [Candidatus Lindowbacteria bacterium]
MEDAAKIRYDRNAWLFDFQDSLFGAMMAKWKYETIKLAKGKVLEVGVGTGKSLPYYPKGIELVGIDISPKMLARAQTRTHLFLTPKALTLQIGDVQALGFSDNSFDMVITSCVFCSVTDPVRGFKEINRVLRPGGTGLHLEHVRSKRPVVGKLMDIMNPLVVRMAGANINRDTETNIRKSGLRIVEVKDLWLDILKLFRVTKGDAPRKV